MYKFQPIMQLARKIDSDEIKSKRKNLIKNYKRGYLNKKKIIF